MAPLRFRSVAGSIALVLLVGCGGGGSDGASQKTTPVASLPPASTPVQTQQPTAPASPAPITPAPTESAATGELPPVDETPSSNPSAPSQVAEVPAGESPTDPSLGEPVQALPPEAPGSGTVQLSWAAPAENADGGALGKLSGYRIRYGRSKNDLDQSVFVENPSVNTYVIENLQKGAWYFDVVAINGENIEGPPSNQATKIIA